MNNRETALLINHLQVPLILRDLLENPARLPDDMVYSLHCVLSDMRPDAALLASAFSVQILVKAMDIPSTGDAVLYGLCARIIEDYAPRWMVAMNDKEAAQGFLMDVFPKIESDLRTLAGMLDTAAAVQKDAKISKLLGVLSVQSKAQADIAEEFMNLMECEFMQGESLFPATPMVFKGLEEGDYSDFDMDACRYDTPRGKIVAFPATV